MVGSPVGEAVNQPWVPVKGKNHRLIGGEDGIEIPIGKSVRMLGGRLECHEIDYVHDPDLQSRVSPRVDWTSLSA